MALALLAGAPLAACSAAVQKPRLAGPGTAPEQRYNATQFDPFPPNDLGPEISGGRPIDYLSPPNEVTRSRQHLAGTPARAPKALSPTTITPIGPAVPVAPSTMPTTLPTYPTLPTTYPTTMPATPVGSPTFVSPTPVYSPPPGGSARSPSPVRY